MERDQGVVALYSSEMVVGSGALMGGRTMAFVAK